MPSSTCRTTRRCITTTRVSQRSRATPATKPSPTSDGPSSCSRGSARTRAGTTTSPPYATTRDSSRPFAEAQVPRMREMDLVDDVRCAVRADASAEARASRAADVIRTRTGRRWVGIYRVTDDEVMNLSWSGPGPPAYPSFPVERGLTGVAIRSGSTIVSDDVASDSRYLTNQESTGSELIAPV